MRLAEAELNAERATEAMRVLEAWQICEARNGQALESAIRAADLATARRYKARHARAREQVQAAQDHLDQALARLRGHGRARALV